MYLDSDTYVVRNIDELFDCPQDSGVSNLSSSYKNGIMNGGLMVIHPQNKFIHDFNKFLEDSRSCGHSAIETLKSNQRGELEIVPLFTNWYMDEDDTRIGYPFITDQDYTSLYFKYWSSQSRHLPYIYNFHGLFHLEVMPSLVDVGAVKVFHLCGGVDIIHGDKFECPNQQLKQILYKYLELARSVLSETKERY